MLAVADKVIEQLLFTASHFDASGTLRHFAAARQLGRFRRVKRTLSRIL